MIKKIKYMIGERIPWKIFLYLRKQKPITKLFGRRYSRSRKFIELDITYLCNLNCINCNRSCRQAPTTEQMTVEQIKKFVRESIEKDYNWEIIRVLGGEPTTHPDLLEIFNILLEYKRSQHTNKAKIILVTNGFGKRVNEVLSTIPKGIEIKNSSKQSPVQDFYPFNIAPKDRLRSKYSDYSNGCWIIRGCGIGLSPYGYYPCGIAGGIDRVFAFDKGRKSLPDKSDHMFDQLEHFCKYCGHFNQITKTKKEIMSKTWKKAYKKYKEEKPELTLY